MRQTSQRCNFDVIYEVLTSAGFVMNVFINDILRQCLVFLM